MGKRALRVIGLMSGTSADGIDVALAEVSGAPPTLRTKLVAHTTVSMSGTVRKEILRVAEGGSCTAADISQLNFRVGEEFAAAASAGCRKFGLKLQQVQLIGSHGQTIFHSGAAVPFLGQKTASTLQIGEPAIIAARTGIPTVADFRVADMAVGGQGAPLVPYVDWLLLRDERVGRVALNLGGIGNVTVLPAGERNPAKVIAFDTGPGNMIIDALAAHFSAGRARYDKDARMARRGQCVTSLLQELLRDPYLRLKPPKSTGRGHYGKEFVRTLLGKARILQARPQDLVRTATVFTALSVVDALHRFVLPRVKIGQVIVSGGGAKNPLIIAQLAAALAPIKVLRSSEVGIDEDAKEAYAFALLAYETWNRRTGNMRSATGASRETVLGKLCLP
jgi:anhydro-N-acetylmuramic acid kinase